MQVHLPDFQGQHVHIVGKEPNGFSGLCAASYRMVASHASCPPNIPVNGIGAKAGWAFGNKPRPGDANTPIINGLLLGLVTVITPRVFAGNIDFQRHFHGFITAIARFITVIKPLLQE